jgi:hypothetical protein
MCIFRGCSNQNGDRACGVYYQRVAFCCAILWAKGLNAKDVHTVMIPVYGGKCLSSKEAHNCVDTFSQGRSKVADDARPGRHVVTATEAIVQRVEELIRVDRRIRRDSAATALGVAMVLHTA